MPLNAPTTTTADPDYAVTARMIRISMTEPCDGDGCANKSSIDAWAYRMGAEAKESLGYVHVCTACYTAKLRALFGIPSDANIAMPERLS